MKAPTLDKIREKFFEIIEAWGEDRQEGADCWAQGTKDRRQNAANAKEFIKEKKKEIEDFLEQVN